MQNINWSVILGEAKKYMDTPKMKKQIEKRKDSYLLSTISLNEANINLKSLPMLAQKFIRTLQKSIIASQGMDYSGGQIGYSAAEALTNLYKSEPYKIGDKYCVDIFFGENLQRESLYPAEYPEGIDDIAVVLNKGINSNKTEPVRGTWHGDRVQGLLHRTGAHFMQRAVEDFRSTYGKDYPYLEITIDEKYI